MGSCASVSGDDFGSASGNSLVDHFYPRSADASEEPTCIPDSTPHTPHEEHREPSSPDTADDGRAGAASSAGGRRVILISVGASTNPNSLALRELVSSNGGDQQNSNSPKQGESTKQQQQQQDIEVPHFDPVTDVDPPEEVIYVSGTAMINRGFISNANAMATENSNQALDVGGGANKQQGSASSAPTRSATSLRGTRGPVTPTIPMRQSLISFVGADHNPHTRGGMSGTVMSSGFDPHQSSSFFGPISISQNIPLMDMLAMEAASQRSGLSVASLRAAGSSAVARHALQQGNVTSVLVISGTPADTDETGMFDLPIERSTSRQALYIGDAPQLARHGAGGLFDETPVCVRDKASAESFLDSRTDPQPVVVVTKQPETTSQGVSVEAREFTGMLPPGGLTSLSLE